MATVIYMPEVLANVTEAAISSWAVKEGDTISVGDTLAEVETEKAVVDFASEHQGTIAKLLIAAGDSVEVGAPIAVLRSEGETDSDVANTVSGLGDTKVAAPIAEPEPAPTLSQTPAQQPAPVRSGTAAADASTQPTAASTVSGSLQERHFASPLARRLVRENGLTAEDIVGTGPGGRIVRRDVERALTEQPTQPVVDAAPRVAPAAPKRRTESSLPAHSATAHTRMRKTIARRLTESKTSVPHYYVTADCRVDALLDLRAQINVCRDTKVSVNDLVLKAVAKALVAVPEANVMWTDEDLLHFEDVNVSVAIATEDGLVTPVIRSVASLSLDAVSREARAFAEAARENKIRPEMLEGGTFTVSNLGMFGLPEFSAILNPPQAGILAVGAAIEKPIAVGGEVVIASMMRVTLSADHRAIDGAVAARLVMKFKEIIERPLDILV